MTGPTGGASAHLVGAAPVPALALESTSSPVGLAELGATQLVLFVYPHATGLPDAPVPGWDLITGARGCTAQSCSFRDHHDGSPSSAQRLAGLGVQTINEQRQFAARVGLHYPLLSDPDCQLAAALGLPTFTASGRTFYERLTLIASKGRIVLHPVAAPERKASDVVGWLEHERRHRTD
jgi:peroxiredoxin